MPGSSEANQSAWNSVFCRLLDLDEKYRKAHWDGYGRAASGNMFGLGTNRAQDCTKQERNNQKYPEAA